MNQQSQLPTEILQKLERDPENVALWRQYLFRCFERNQTDIVYSLQVIIKGLEELNRQRDLHNSMVLEPSPEMAEALLEFAQNPKSRELLIQVAQVYETNYYMQDVARVHVERAQALGRDEAKTSASKSKSLKPASAGSTTFGVSGPALDRQPALPLQKSEPTPFTHKTQPVGVSWPEFQTKLEELLGRIQRRMSSLWGPASVRPLRLPKAIPALQWLDFLENHLSVQFSVAEMKNMEKVELPETQPAHKENPVVRAQELIIYLERVETSLGTTTKKAVRTQSLTPAMQWLTDHMAEITEMIKVGRLSDAELKLLDRLSDNIPKEQLSSLWSNLGLQYQNRHDNKKALAAYQKSVEFYSDNLQSWFNSGLLLQGDRNFPAALQCYLKATILAPNQAKFWCNLGVLQFEMGDQKNSVESLRKAVELNPDYTRAWVNLAASLCAAQEYRGAERCCQRAMKLNPEIAEPAFKLGFINFQLGELNAAEHNFYSALKLQPGFPLAEFYLVIIMARTNRLAEGLQICEVAVPPEGDVSIPAMAWSELGYGLFEEGDFESALHCYGKVLEFTPESASAWHEVGIVHHRLGNLEEARKNYQQATTLDKENVQIWQNLASICQDLGDTEQERRANQQIDRLSPK